MLALKKFIPFYTAALCIKAHSALLAAWIESNILMELDATPFDKQDEMLVSGAIDQLRDFLLAQHRRQPTPVPGVR